MGNSVEKFITSNNNWKDQFLLFYIRNQIHPFHFGKKIYTLFKHDITKINYFLQVAIEAISISENDKRDILIIGGFLSNLDNERKELFFKTIENNETYARYLFYFLSIEAPSPDNIRRLFHLVARYSVSVSIKEFVVFEHKKYLSILSDYELVVFCSRLMTYGKDGCQVLFNLLTDHINDDPGRAETILIPFIRGCINEIISIHLDSAEPYEK